MFDPEALREPVKIRLNAVRLDRSRSFGAVCLGLKLWQALKLDELLSALMPPGRKSFRCCDVVAILVIGRLFEPSSELHVAER